MVFSSSSETRPSWPPLPLPPQADSSGMPPTAAVATAVEARKDLRLGPEREFGMTSAPLRDTALLSCTKYELSKRFDAGGQ
jgi:hypothetical protein